VAGLLQLDKSGEGRVLAPSRSNATAAATPLQLDKTGATRVIGASHANATSGASELSLTRSGEELTITPSRANATSTAAGTLTPSTTVFNVLSYGAHADGVTNDSDHIQAAYNAARANSASGSHSTVYFPAGTYYVSSNVLIGTIRTNDWYGQTSPTVQQAGTVLFSGYGATIKYANTTSRYSWLRMASWPTAQYTTYGNLHVEGFTIDNNYKVPSGVCGYVCWFTGDGNYDNIVFRDITTTDHISPRTAAGTPSPRVSGIVIHGDSVSDDQAHYGYCTNITVEDCTIHAGAKSVSILAENYGSYTASKYLYDEVNILGGYCDNHEFYGSNIHLVQAGRGGRVSIVGCDCRDSADDGIEVNNCDYTLIEDCHFEGNRQAICLTWFSYPLGATTPPETIIRGCTYSGKSGRYWTNDGSYNDLRTPMMPEVRGYTTNTDTANAKDISRGDFTIEDCTFEIGFEDNPTVIRSPLTIGSNTIPMESVTITDCDIRYDGSHSADLIYIKQGAQLAHTLPVHIENVRYANSIAGALAPITASMVTLEGSRTVTGDVSGLS
jgi:hypothetical protein